MKVRLLCVNASNKSFFNEACELYSKKINPFIPFELKTLKPKGIGREQAAQKKEKESQEILKHISEKDFVVLLDEKGKTFDSLQFAKKVEHILSSTYSQVVFVIGGAYGTSEELQKRAQLKVRLSDMTMNHLVATIVLLEQFYRALTIWKGISYHNE